MELKELINYGALGLSLFWFMFRFEPRIKELTDAINRLSQLHIIELASKGEMLPRRSGSSARAARSPAVDDLLAKLTEEVRREMGETSKVA